MLYVVDFLLIGSEFIKKPIEIKRKTDSGTGPIKPKTETLKQKEPKSDESRTRRVTEKFADSLVFWTNLIKGKSRVKISAEINRRKSRTFDDRLWPGKRPNCILQKEVCSTQKGEEFSY